MVALRVVVAGDRLQVVVLVLDNRAPVLARVGEGRVGVGVLGREPRAQEHAGAKEDGHDNRKRGATVHGYTSRQVGNPPRGRTGHHSTITESVQWRPGAGNHRVHVKIVIC